MFSLEGFQTKTKKKSPLVIVNFGATWRLLNNVTGFNKQMVRIYSIFDQYYRLLKPFDKVQQQETIEL